MSVKVIKTQEQVVDKKYVVLYIRYSSQGQNEQTVEGQIRICKEYAEKNGYVVVGIYIDKARTGTNDNRPEFQKMLKAAGTGAFQFILVYKFDRFARNRLDSMMHKGQLKKQYGIRVISATEPVSDDEGGEIYEMFLEWNDEKYSQRLSRRVRDGLTTSVANGTFCGGYLLYGYKIRKEPIAGKNDKFIKYIEIDEEQAPIIKYIFEEFAKGLSKQEICDRLNAQGLRYKGKAWRGRTFEEWLKNRKYTGEFSFGGRESNNMFPPIISQEIFDKVQKRLIANKYFAGANSTREPYLLTGKVFCGHCGTPMVADGGVSRLNKKHCYYACKKKKKDQCDKKRENKIFLELLVTIRAVRYLKEQKRAELIVDDVIRYYEQRTNDESLKSIETKIQHAQSEVEKMTTTFIEAKSKLLRDSIEKRMAECEILLNDLIMQKAQLELEKGLKITKKDLLAFIDELIQGDENDKDFQKRIIDNLLSKVFVYDNKIAIYYNLKGGDEVASVDLEQTNQAVTSSLSVRTQTAPLRQSLRLAAKRCKFFKFANSG